MTARKMMTLGKIANRFRSFFHLGIRTEDKRRQGKRRTIATIASIHEVATKLILGGLLARIVSIRMNISSKIFCSWRLLPQIGNRILRRWPWKKEITSIDLGSGEINRTDLAQLPPEVLFRIMAKMNLSLCSMVKIFPRSWQSIMTHPFFQNSSVHPLPWVSFIVHDETYDSHTHTLVQKDIRSDTFVSIKLDHLEKYNFSYKWDSCNGLMYVAAPGRRKCLGWRSKDSFYLCNPLTSEWVRLPNPPNPKPPPGVRRRVEYSGFGYSPNTNQYKVVRVSCPEYFEPNVDLDNPDNYHSYVHVYTIGTPAWRRIEEDTPFQILMSNALTNHLYFRAIEFNGVLNWLYTTDEINYQVFCFDIETEQLGSFPLPNYGDEAHGFTQIGVLNGCFVTSTYRRCGVMTIYMLEDYNIKNSWVKLGDYWNNSTSITDLIHFDEDGKKVLVSQGGELCYFFATTKLWENLSWVCGDIDNVQTFVRPFVPSFLSPKRIMQQSH